MKTIRPRSDKTYDYPTRDGAALMRVRRVDPGDGSKKSIWQEWYDNGSWNRKDRPIEVSRQAAIYRYAEVRSAIDSGQTIWIVEGESAVDALWSLGISATTTIGGCKGFGSYGDYSSDLSGGNFILAPDCDPTGIKYIAEFAEIIGDRVAGYYLAGNESNWANPCGGFDVVDDIATGMDKSAILGKVIDPARYLVAITSGTAKPNASKPKQPVGRPKKDKSTESTDDKKMPAIEMADMVSADIFKGRIKFDAIAKQYWRYNGSGMWVLEIYENVFVEVQDYIRELIPVFGSNYVEEVIKLSRKHYVTTGWTELPNDLYMPFTNGVLELSSMQLLPHCQSYMFRWQLPRPYCPDIVPFPAIDKFLIEMSCGNSDLKNILIAFCNAILIGRSDLQRFLYLVGSGGNGKGVLTRLMTELVGNKNTCIVDMSKLNDNSFEPSKLEGKRLALMPDCDRSSTGISTFKSATGEDILNCERKGKDGYTFVYRGMFVLAANRPSFTGDSAKALKRRKIDFPCNMQPVKADKDLNSKLDKDLTAFTTYLLSKSREWVSDTLENAEDVAAVKELNWVMTIQEDSIAAFMSEDIVVGSEYSVSSGDLYKAYESFCNGSNMKPKSSVRFTPDLLEFCTKSFSLPVSRKKTKTNNLIIGLKIKSVGENAFDPMLKKLESASSIPSGGLEEKVEGSGGYGGGFKVAPSIDSGGYGGLEGGVRCDRNKLINYCNDENNDNNDENDDLNNNYFIKSSEWSGVQPSTSSTDSQEPFPEPFVEVEGVEEVEVQPSTLDDIAKTADRLKKSFEQWDVYRLKTIHQDTDPSIIALAIDSLDELLQSQVRKMIEKERF